MTTNVDFPTNFLVWNIFLECNFPQIHSDYCCLLLRRRSVQGESDEINQNFAQIPQAYDAAPASRIKFDFQK